MTKCNFVINFQYIFNLFLNMLNTASFLADLMGAAPPIDQPPLVGTMTHFFSISDEKLNKHGLFEIFFFVTI